MNIILATFVNPILVRKAASMDRNQLTAKSQLREFNLLGQNIPYIPLVLQPTPVQFGNYGDLRFLMKREDLTDTTEYGGNKVRNLEFILAAAVLCEKKTIVTPIPVGSNFSAAFVAHSNRVGIDPVLCQVSLASHPQIIDHDDFCRRRLAKMTSRSGMLKFPLVGLDLAKEVLNSQAYFVHPGGSNILGVIGHIKAFFEIVDEIKSGKIAVPNVIYVGAGTGGTTAGLIAGITLSGLPIKVVAVRCAEKLICNSRRIVNLANKTLMHLGSRLRVDASDFDLIESPGNRRYGEPLADFDRIFNRFGECNDIELDRTYTSKVINAMEFHSKSAHFSSSNILYWHTFSSMASSESVRRPFRKTKLRIVN
jgi:1-aminocyclopropane-1-carboxylate deaminase/D-cysteine desulfhydrase-like pyridoxal-dependent ACC family enzyme